MIKNSKEKVVFVSLHKQAEYKNQFSLPDVQEMLVVNINYGRVFDIWFHEMSPGT